MLRFWVKMQFQYSIVDDSDSLCKIVHFTIYAAGPISSWILVTISIDRLIAVVFPRRFLFFFQRKFQIIVLVLIILLNMLYFTFLLFNLELTEEETKKTNNNAQNSFSTSLSSNSSNTTTEKPAPTYQCSSKNIKLIYWLDLLDAAILPFFFMITTDVILIVYIFRSRKRIKSHATNTINVNKISSKDRKFSITSISLNLIFFLFNAPTTIFSLISDDGLLIQNFLHFLFYSHYALGFYVQLAVNSIIRREFLRMMRLGKLIKKNEMRAELKLPTTISQIHSVPQSNINKY